MMNSVRPFSIDFLLRKDFEEEALKSFRGHSYEEKVLSTKETDSAFREFSGKNIFFVTDRLSPSLLFGNGIATQADQNKKARTCFTFFQKDELEKSFRQSPYLQPQALQKLAIELGLSKASVQTWYKNRRYRWRRQKGVTSVPHGAFVSMPTGCMSPYSAGSCLGHCPQLCQTEMSPCCSGSPPCTPGVLECPLPNVIGGQNSPRVSLNL